MISGISSLFEYLDPLGVKRRISRTDPLAVAALQPQALLSLVLAAAQGPYMGRSNNAQICV